jgi:WD40 repeat protein
VTPILRDDRRGNRPRFSPDSQTLAVFDEGGVRLWKIDSWTQSGILPGARFSLWFAPDGKTLLALGTNEWLQFWDLPSQSVRSSVRLAFAEVPFTRVAASADGKLLATISAAEPRQVALWDTTSGQPEGSMTGKVRGSNADDGTLALSPDGRFLANCGDGVDVWDLRTRERYWAFSPHRSTVNQLVFAPDKDTFATCSADGTVKLWSLAGRREVATFTQDAEVRDIAFSPDGRTLASAGKDGLLKLWNLSTDREIATIKTGAVLAFLEFSPDNRCLAYGDWRGLLMFRSASPAEIDDRRATANRIAAGEGLPARLAFTVPDLAAGLSLALPKSP